MHFCIDHLYARLINAEQDYYPSKDEVIWGRFIDACRHMRQLGLL